MGIYIDLKKELSSLFKRKLQGLIAEKQRMDELYLQMTTEELRQLPDEKLFYAVVVRIDDKVDAFDNIKDGINSLNEKERIVYAVNYFEMEVNNGGICQFFVNTSRVVAPLVSEYMGIIGAGEHKKLYDDFISQNSIDVSDLSSFDSETAEDFSAQYQRYPFNDYDNKFYKMATLESYLTAFIKSNIEYFRA